MVVWCGCPCLAKEVFLLVLCPLVQSPGADIPVQQALHRQARTALKGLAFQPAGRVFGQVAPAQLASVDSAQLFNLRDLDITGLFRRRVESIEHVQAPGG